jgi:DNA-binding transcriptional LysR family regulator
MRFMQMHPKLQIELNFEDRVVSLIEQGIDLAIRMGPMVDSTLGARYLGTNPWVVVASQDYLDRCGMPTHPSDLLQHEALIYSTVQGDARWQLTGGEQSKPITVPVHGPLRSNNLSALLMAARNGLGIAALPRYVAQESLKSGTLTEVLVHWSLPSQEIHAVYPSPLLVPAKVSGFVGWLQSQIGDDWWECRW